MKTMELLRSELEKCKVSCKLTDRQRDAGLYKYIVLYTAPNSQQIYKQMERFLLRELIEL